MHISGSTNICRIGLFIDGSYFGITSNYYLHNHPRGARLSIEGLQAFVRRQVAREEGVDEQRAHITESHYFRGRSRADEINDLQTLYRERIFDDVLISHNVEPHFLPTLHGQEKGVDVWLALEAYEKAAQKNLDVVVLVAGDSDFIPLVRKLQSIGARVMVLGWTFDYLHNGDLHGTRASGLLLAEANYPLAMAELIDDPEQERIVAGLFHEKRESQDMPSSANDEAGGSAASEAKAYSDAACRGDSLMLQVENRHSMHRWVEGEVAMIGHGNGYGFIRTPHYAGNVFFHKSALDSLQAFRQIRAGDRVSFEMATNHKGVYAKTVLPLAG